MKILDLDGYHFDSRIFWSTNRLILLWFSKVEREDQRWTQVQVTLVGARLLIANLEVEQCFPPMTSYEVTRKSSVQGSTTTLLLSFGASELRFECEQLVFSKYSRKIRVL